MNTIRIITALLAAALVFPGDSSAQTQVPNDFQAGQPARAAEVNENFDTLETAIDQNAAGIDQNSSAVEANAAGIGQNAAGIAQNAADILAVQGLAGLSPEAAQIQTALDLTSGLRWLIADFYVNQGIFPPDNATAGAEPANAWQNRFVSSASVVNGAIAIDFGGNAAEQLAGRQVFLTPTDPGSGAVWFDCTGDGVTDPYVAELDCAFSDLPPQPMYRFRQIVLTALDMLEKSNAQQAVEDYYALNGAFPSDNVQAGLAHPSAYQGKFISELTVSEFGQITITFGNDAPAVLSGETLAWSPDATSAVINWACASLDLANKYLPIDCRS